MFPSRIEDEEGDDDGVGPATDSPMRNMKALLSILFLCLASCVPQIADVRAPDKLDVAPVAKAVDETVVAGEKVDAAVKEVRKATNEVKEANAKASELTIRLKEQMNRIRIIAEGNAELQEAQAAAEATIAEMTLSNRDMGAKIWNLETTVLTLEVGNEALLLSNHTLALRMEELQKDKAEQDIQITRTKETLKAAAQIQPKLLIAEDKLHWWRWRFLPASIGVALFLLAAITGLILIIIYKPRIPFIS